MSEDGLKDQLDSMRRKELAAHEEFLRQMNATYKSIGDQLAGLNASVRLLGENVDRVRTSLGDHIEQSLAETQALIKSLVKR